MPIIYKFILLILIISENYLIIFFIIIKLSTIFNKNILIYKFIINN